MKASRVMIVAVFAVAVVCASGADTPPKTVPLNPQQVAQMQKFNERAQSLAKELEETQRAITAERRVLQMEFEKWTGDNCKSLGKEGCSLNATSANPQEWAWTLPEPPKPETAKPPASVSPDTTKKEK